MALPVEKSRACLTAITIAINAHIETANVMNPPSKGMKPSMLNTAGESEKPIQRNSSP